MSASENMATPLTAASARPGMAAWQRILLVLAGVVVAIAPLFLLESFHLFQLTMAVIMALAVLGLNIVSGYNGQISLGHGAFFAVGAYVTAILMSHLDWSFWATLPVSVVPSMLCRSSTSVGRIASGSSGWRLPERIDEKSRLAKLGCATSAAIDAAYPLVSSGRSRSMKSSVSTGSVAAEHNRVAPATSTPMML